MNGGRKWPMTGPTEDKDGQRQFGVVLLLLHFLGRKLQLSDHRLLQVSSVVNCHDDVRQTPARVARHSWRCHVEHPGHVTAGTWLGHFHTHITHVTTAIQPFTRHCCRCSFDRHQQHSGKRPLATWKGHNLPCKVLARKKGGPVGTRLSDCF